MLIIMRGPSGSGKSTVVEQMCKHHPFTVCSADHFFMVDGKYKFDPSQLKKNHFRCQERCKDALGQGKHVIIDNTNLIAEEVKTYVDLAHYFGTEFYLVNPGTPTHIANPKGLSQDVIDRQSNKYEPDWVVILKLNGLYKIGV